MRKANQMFIQFGICLKMENSTSRHLKQQKKQKMPYKGVRGKGTVRISEDINANIPIAKKIMIKYTGNLDNEVAKFLMNAVKNGFSVLLEITPKYFATWDHSTGFTEPEHFS